MHVSIGAAIPILGLIYFAIISPGFRLLLFWSVGILAAGIGALIYYNTK
jgi:hypothetical protein